MNEEKSITLAAKFYEHRKGYRSFVSAERYAETTDIAKTIIRSRLKEFDGNHVQAVLAILKESPPESPTVLPCFVSAMLDMIEAA